MKKKNKSRKSFKRGGLFNFGKVEKSLEEDEKIDISDLDATNFYNEYLSNEANKKSNTSRISREKSATNYWTSNGKLIQTIMNHNKDSYLRSKILDLVETTPPMRMKRGKGLTVKEEKELLLAINKWLPIMHQINSNTDPVLRTGVKKLITAFFDMIVRLGLVHHLATQLYKTPGKMVVQTLNPFKKSNDIPMSGIIQGTSDEYSGFFGKVTGSTGTRKVSENQDQNRLEANATYDSLKPMGLQDKDKSNIQNSSDDHQLSEKEESNYNKNVNLEKESNFQHAYNVHHHDNNKHQGGLFKNISQKKKKNKSIPNNLRKKKLIRSIKK